MQYNQEVGNNELSPGMDEKIQELAWALSLSEVALILVQQEEQYWSKLLDQSYIWADL